MYRKRSRPCPGGVKQPRNVPFTVTTGKDHWHVLLRARAIESQAYVLAPAQWGKHPAGRLTYGKSLIAGSIDRDVPTEFYVYAFDEKDLIRDFAFQKVTFDMSKLRTQLESKGVKFYTTLLLPPGDFSLRVLVRTAAGRSGFTTARVHVPKETEPLAAPLMLDDPAGWVMVKAQERPSRPRYPFVAGDNTFVPAAHAVIATGSPYTVAVMAYNVAPDNVQVQASLEGGGGSPRDLPLSYLGRTEPDVDGGVKLLYELRPPRLDSGQYQIVMNVRASEAAPIRTVSVPVEVH